MENAVELPGPVKSSVFSLDLKSKSEFADLVWSDSEFHTLGAENLKAESADLMKQKGADSKNLELKRNGRADACFSKQPDK